MENKDKIILDLCGGTGSWSKPYKDAGYDVRVITLPQYNIHHFIDIMPDNVYGILAAPPCTMFSMARSKAKTPRDLEGAMKTVQACLAIIWKAQYQGKRLQFWAMENPKARLRWFMGKPAMTFNPFDYGDPHRKPTDIWGNFNTKLKKKPVTLDEKQIKLSQTNSRELPKIPIDYIRDSNMSKQAVARSITPQGFARAFFLANQ